LAQLIAEQFGIAEVNIKYFTLSFIKHTLTTADDSKPERKMAGGRPACMRSRDCMIIVAIGTAAMLFVCIVNQKVN